MILCKYSHVVLLCGTGMPTRVCQCRKQSAATNGIPNTRGAGAITALAAWAFIIAWCSRISLLEILQCQVELFC